MDTGQPRPVAGHSTGARRSLTAAALAVAGALPVYGQQLNVETFDVRRGLSHAQVSNLYQDRAGYLWITTWEGLTRFDGRRFDRFGLDDGLPPSVLNAAFEDLEGTLWIATNGAGLARFVDGLTPRFETIRLGLAEKAEFVNDAVVDRDGRFWCATDGGLVLGVREDHEGAIRLRFRVVHPYPDFPREMVALRDARDLLWIGLGSELVIVDPEDTPRGPAIEAFPTPDREPIVGVAPAPAGSSALVVTERHVFEFDRGRTPRWRDLGWQAPKPTRYFSAARAQDATWVGGEGEIWEIRDGRRTRWRISDALRPPVSALAPDREGNLWIGTTQGLYRVPPRRIVQFTRDDGLRDSAVTGLLATRDGLVVAATMNAGVMALRDDGARLMRGTDTQDFAALNGRVVVTSDGRWFGATDAGIHRLVTDSAGRLTIGPRLASVTAADGLKLDNRGRLWVRMGGELSISFRIDGDRLVRDEPTRNPPKPLPGFLALTTSPSGSLWLSTMVTLLRVHGDDAELLTTQSGLLETRVRAMLLDSRGWLWLGQRYRGLGWTREPDAPVPRFEALTVDDGLLSNTVSCLTEGGDGHIYAATGRGLNRIDPKTGRAESVGPASVLDGLWLRHCLTDASGRVWAASALGVARVDAPGPSPPNEPPPLYITRVEIGGMPHPLSSRGAREVGGVAVPPGAGALRISFAGVSLRPERGITYEYRMAGLDDEWHPAGDVRTIEYGRLPAGAYRFEVRAAPVTTMPPAVASVSLAVAAPLWRRPWAVALGLGVLILLAGAAHHVRLRHLLELERVRRQVALDLHDDLGSGLAQIAILSEVARRDETRTQATLETVGQLSRRLREAMAAIVWAIDPRYDTLMDVVARIRFSALNLLEAQGIRVVLDVPPAAVLRSTALGAPLRRNLLLAATELVTNAARHSGATTVRMTLRIDPHNITLVLSDDGHGFDPAKTGRTGQGLTNLQQRGREMGGVVTVRSSSAGTEISVVVPRHGRRRPARSGNADPHAHAVDGPDRGA